MPVTLTDRVVQQAKAQAHVSRYPTLYCQACT